MELIIFTSSDPSRAAIAAALFNALGTPSIACAIAAVPDPTVPIDPVVLSSFNELKLGRLPTPSRFTDELGAWAAEIIHVGSRSNSFPISGPRILEWDVADPRKQPLEEVNHIRDWIRHLVERHLRDRGFIGDGGDGAESD